MKFLNTATGVTEDLDNEQSKQALLNPAFQPVDQQKFYLKDSKTDEIHEFADVNAVRDLSAQYPELQPITHHDVLVQDFKDQGIVGDIKAAAAGFASGATLGLSDAAARAMGFGEEVAAAKEASPIATGAGEVASAFIPGGGIVGVAGKAVKGAAVVQKAATAMGKAGALLPGAAQMATEGALIGLQQGISTVSLKDTPLLTADNAAEVARDVLFGAGFGVGLYGVGKAAKEGAVEAFKRIPGQEKAPQWLNNAFATTVSVMPTTNISKEAMLEILDKKKRDMYTSIEKNFTDIGKVNADNIINSFDNVSTKTQGQLATTRKQFLDNANITHQTLIDVNDSVRRLADSTEGVSSTVTSEAKRILGSMDNTAEGIFKTQSKLKEIQRNLYKNQNILLKEADREAIQTTINQIDDALRIANPDMFDALKTTNDAYAAMKRTEKVLKRYYNPQTGKISTDRLREALSKPKVAIRVKEDIQAMKDIYAKNPEMATAVGDTLQSILDVASTMDTLKNLRRLSPGTLESRMISKLAPVYGVFGGLNPVIAGVSYAVMNPMDYLRMADQIANYGAKTMPYGKAITYLSDVPVSKRADFISKLKNIAEDSNLTMKQKNKANIETVRKYASQSHQEASNVMLKQTNKDMKALELATNEANTTVRDLNKRLTRVNDEYAKIENGVIQEHDAVILPLKAIQQLDTVANKLESEFNSYQTKMLEALDKRARTTVVTQEEQDATRAAIEAARAPVDEAKRNAWDAQVVYTKSQDARAKVLAEHPELIVLRHERDGLTKQIAEQRQLIENNTKTINQYKQEGIATAPRATLEQELIDAEKTTEGILSKLVPGQRARIGTMQMVDDLSKKMFDQFKSNPEQYKQHIEALGNPDQNRINTALQRSAHYHPDMAQNTAARFAQVQMWLANRAPQPRRSLRDPNKWQMPTESDLRKYTEDLAIASDPYGVIRRSGGNLTDRQLKALAEVYPEIYKAINPVASRGSDISGAMMIQEAHAVYSEEPPEAKAQGSNVTAPGVNAVAK